ncbi:MAG: cation diffusion facilitator family transporter [Cyanobacteria bacterium HKST-UBA02]|nr:cation diffusion facilitator family transporter [Cyanobacteria bacterium HKST-UBA02]
MTRAKSLAFFSNPFFVMGLVLFMYAVKAAVKITLGASINSPMIEGDGFHNLADILEALAVMAVIYVSKLPSSDEYPFGRKNIEFFASLAIGIGLLALSFQFATRSIGGMLFYFPTLDQAVRSVIPLPTHEPLVMDPGTFPVVLGISLVSVVLSVVVSRYQIAVGRSSGHASLVADGEETASDSRIEFVTLGGILAEYAFDAPYLEYPLGLLVAFLIARTGWELFSRAWKVLLQHSLGAEREAEIRKLCLTVPGVVELASLKTFQVGQTAVVMVTVVTRRGSGPSAFMKYGLEHIVESYLLGDEFKECELSVKFQKPSPERYRVAYAVDYGDQVTVAASLTGASHLVICDVEAGAIVRTKYEPLGAVLSGGKLDAYLETKHIRDLFVFDPEDEDNRKLLGDSSVNLLPAVSYIPSVLGF